MNQELVIPLPARSPVSVQPERPGSAQREGGQASVKKALIGEVVYLYAFDVANEIITQRVRGNPIRKAIPVRNPDGSHVA